jgi:hypothetical protein
MYLINKVIGRVKEVIVRSGCAPVIPALRRLRQEGLEFEPAWAT